MKYFSLVWCNLKRKKLRTSLTLLSIAVAFLLFGILCTVKNAFTAGVTMADADRLFTTHKVTFTMLLPGSYQERIRQIPGVALVAHETWFNGIYQDKPENFFGSFPVEPENFLAVFPEYLLPEEQKQAWFKTRTGAVVGRTLADKFKWKVGSRVPLRSPIWPFKGEDKAWEFDIVGIYDGAKKATDTSGFFFRYDYFDEGRASAKGQVGWYIVRVKDAAQTAEVVKRIDTEFANSPYETKTQPEGTLAQGFVQQFANFTAMLISILSAVFFTILLIAGNTMAQAVRERTEELGVLKALGFPDGLVLVLVLAESCVIAGIGGLLGLGATWLITLHGNPAPMMLPVFYLPHRDLVIGLGLTAALGVVTGILPAIQAMRLQIAVALRRHA